MSYAPGTFRLWDGTQWVYDQGDWVDLPYEVIQVGGTTGKAASTTTCTRSPASVAKGSPVTVTATSTGRDGGNIEFYYRVGSGSWVKFATKPAPGVGINVVVTHTPGSTGTSYQARFTGSATFAPSSSAATPSTTVTGAKTATKIVNMGWHQAYNGAGNRISGSGRDNAIHQGYYSSTHGNRRSLLRFDPNLPASANVTKVIFDCNSAWEHWYNGSGGTIVVGSFNDQSSEPSSWPSGKVNTNRSRKGVDTGGFTVDISSWACGAVERSDFSGITIGAGPSTSHEYYGYSQANPSGSDFQLHVTYTYWS